MSIEDEVDRHLAYMALKSGLEPPLVDVTVKGECSGRRCKKAHGKALFDTGSKRSFIDEKLVKKLGLRQIGRGKIRGVAGGKRPLVLDRYAVNLSFPGLRDVPLMLYGAYAKNGQEELGRLVVIGRDTMAGGDNSDAGMRATFDGTSGQLRLKPAKRKARKTRK